MGSRLALLVLTLALAVGIALPATAGASQNDGRVLFSGARPSSWPLNQSAAASRVQEVPDPAGGAGDALRFEAFNKDVFPLTPTHNPRAQLITPLTVRPGGQFWESFEVYVPESFPVAATYRGWLALGSPAYGAPWAGSPSTNLLITGGDFRFQRNGYGAHPWQITWQTPLILGRWTRFTWHIGFSKDGFVQLFMNGAPQALADGNTSSTTLHMPVIDPTDSKGPWISQLSAYYKKDEFPDVTLYFRDFKIATTHALAQSATQ
jgi:hypothetical protein